MGRASPWEIAGRVGRSGAVDTSDVWTMAGPLGEGAAAGSGSGVLSLLPVLSVAYACYPEDGLNAAARLSLLRDDDLRAEAVGRAAFSLIRRVLMAGGFDKDGWLREAAGDAGDLDSERELRSVRVKDWRYLRGEECAMGRMERVVYLWYRGDCYERIMREGVKFLRSRESLDYLAALTAATYGRDGMPPDVVQAGAGDRKVMELVNDLHDLATSEAVLRVAPEEDDEEDL